MICPVCKYNIDDADYWDDNLGICVRCALDQELKENNEIEDIHNNYDYE